MFWGVFGVFWECVHFGGFGVSGVLGVLGFRGFGIWGGVWGFAGLGRAGIWGDQLQIGVYSGGGCARGVWVVWCCVCDGVVMW